MKKLILLALIAVTTVGCTKRDSKGNIILNDGDNNPYVSIIDSCEYINWGYGMSHKGNCCFCKERRKKEYVEIIDSLFNMQE